MKRLQGNEIKAKHWDSFYRSTGTPLITSGDTVYGRLWGCHPRSYYPSLHFEACYYQAIEAAIEPNLKTVEAGAQGEHKIQRGYMPVPTYSCHNLLDEDFSKVKLVMKMIQDSGPFKEGID
ncbi:hypothetical protein NL676_013058 [Syzygium grande]|nr:hypothetical protein NL676_013058 [Syzygium grande]